MDDQYYEMPKWSTWEIETWISKGNNPIFQMYRQFKWATLDLDEVKYLDRDKDFDEFLFKLFPTFKIQKKSKTCLKKQIQKFLKFAEKAQNCFEVTSTQFNKRHLQGRYWVYKKP